MINGTDDQILNRARGALFGQAAGDALGSQVEFQDAADIRRRYPNGLRIMGASPVWGTLPGQPTDDTELAFALADSLLHDPARGYHADAAASAYAEWFESSPFDMGNATHRALSAASRARRTDTSPAEAAKANADPRTEANGALMRQSPLAVWGVHVSEAVVVAAVAEDTELTHPTSAAIEVSQIFIASLRMAIREGLTPMQTYTYACDWHRRHGTIAAISELLQQAAHKMPAFKPQQGWVRIACQNAFYQLLHTASPEEGIVATVMGGGDTDTNGAITGALLGGVYGLDAFPEAWQAVVRACQPEAGSPDVRHPRPTRYWPARVFEDAPALLSAGRQHGQAEARHHQSPSLTSSVALNRFQGALLGGALGDAAGFPYEQRAVTEVHCLPVNLRETPARVSDDTELTLAVAHCLVDQGWMDPEDLSRRFAKWLPGGTGIGGATRRAVNRLTGGQHWLVAGEESGGNGAAMRVAPVALRYWNDPARRRTAAILSALPTHRGFMGVAGTVAMAEAVATLLTESPDTFSPGRLIRRMQESIQGMEPHPTAERRDPTSRVTLSARLGELLGMIEDDPTVVFSRLYNGAFVLESLPAALYCFLRTPTDPETTIGLAIGGGRDADTVAAMAGTLSGALNGLDHLPTLVRQLGCCEELMGLANQLYRASL